MRKIVDSLEMILFCEIDSPPKKMPVKLQGENTPKQQKMEIL